MPSRDIYHANVRNALEKEEWSVTDDPYFVKAGALNVYIDLGATRL